MTTSPPPGEEHDTPLVPLVDLDAEAVDGEGLDDDGDDDDDGDGDEDVVVLSWWQHPVNVISLLVATALIAGMIGWLISDASSEQSAGEVDVGFLQDMRGHHDQAVQMAFMYLALPDTDPELRTVARSIVLSQGIDIGRMIELLRGMNAPEAAETDEAMAWMGMPTTQEKMPGMATEEQLDALGAARGAEADRLFIELMSAHHQGGIHMADFATTEAEDPEVRSMAAAMADSQGDEILELEGLAN